MDKDLAFKIIAQDVISSAMRRFEEDSWENYPDIGEEDWDAIIAMALNMTDPPTSGEYESAYDFLEARAQKFDEEATLYHPDDEVLNAAEGFERTE